MWARWEEILGNEHIRLNMGSNLCRAEAVHGEAGRGTTTTTRPAQSHSSTKSACKRRLLDPTHTLLFVLPCTVQMFLLLCPPPVNLRVTQVTADPLTPPPPPLLHFQTLTRVWFCRACPCQLASATSKCTVSQHTHTHTHTHKHTHKWFIYARVCMCVWREEGQLETDRK